MSISKEEARREMLDEKYGPQHKCAQCGQYFREQWPERCPKCAGPLCGCDCVDDHKLDCESEDENE